MDIFLFSLGFVGGLFFLVLLVVNLIRKKPLKRSAIGLAVCFALIIVGATMGMAGSTSDKDIAVDSQVDKSSPDRPKEEAKTTEVDADINDPIFDRKSEIETLIKDRINDGDYGDAKLEKITINENLGTDKPDAYIALVYLDFNRANKRQTGNEVMRMFSDDLVATLAKQGVTDVSEAAIFWKDDYNNRNVKYAYEYRNGGFYITDIMGE